MAVKSQGSFVSVGTATAGAAKAITAITSASPGVATSTAHAMTNGTVGVMTGVGGMQNVNNRAFVVRNTAANAFDLSAQNTTIYSTYTSGGSFQPWTMAEIGECRSVTGLDGEAPEIDTTHLKSQNKESILGIADPGNVTLVLFHPAGTDPGQARLRDLRESGLLVPFTITDSVGRVLCFTGLVKSFAISGLEPDGAMQITCGIRVSNAVTWFA